MGILSSIMAPEFKPVREALELLEQEIEDIRENYVKEMDALRRSLSDADEKILVCNETIVLLETKVTALEKLLKSGQTTTSSDQDQHTRQNGSDKPQNNTNQSTNINPTSNQISNTPDSIKRFFSSCGTSGFEVAYLLSNPAAISGQGYYEVTDNGDDTGSYQPNVELAATLLMNASNMLEPYFEVQHDDSGKLRVISPGEVLRQGRAWQIVEKCKIAY